MGHVLFEEIMEVSKKIYHMEVREDDTWVVTLPKTGTTWMTHIVSAIKNLKTPVKSSNKWYFLEFEGFGLDKGEFEEKSKQPAKADDEYDQSVSYTECISASSPRNVKTHLPISMLPPKLLDKCKVIYVARNPQDTCVSFYYHEKAFGPYNGDFQSFFKLFVNNQLYYTPYWTHLKEAFGVKEHPNLLFIFYEDMKSDFKGSLHKIAEFLGHNLSSSEVEMLADTLSIRSMKKNAKDKVLKDVILRKGIVGDWKNHFTDDMIEDMKHFTTKGAEGCKVDFPDQWSLH